MGKHTGFVSSGSRSHRKHKSCLLGVDQLHETLNEGRVYGRRESIPILKPRMVGRRAAYLKTARSSHAVVGASYEMLQGDMTGHIQKCGGAWHCGPDSRNS